MNYPKLHIRHGEEKNKGDRTGGWYKPSVRMFKNARRQIIGDDDNLRKQFPSYFVECLFYNVPDDNFGYSYQQTFTKALNFLSTALANEASDKFTTQSGQHWLFGTASVQWPKASAKDFVSRLAQLWNA